MNRSRLLAAVLAVLACLLVVLPALRPLPAVSQAARPEIRGVWMTLNDMATLRDRSRMQEAVAKLAELNFNTLYPVAWNGGYAYYPSEVTQREGIQRFTFRGLDGQDVLGELIAEAHQRGLLVMPWFEFGFMAPPTSELALRHPAWLTRKQDGGKTSISAGGEVVWLNPFRPEVQKFITDLVVEIVSKYDADGIQFDDHMSLPSEFGYDDYTLSLYSGETGRSPNSPQDPAWVRWRADRISAFMERLHKAIEARRPNTIVSVSPNYYDFAYKLQLQDWLGWVRRRIVDEIVVQIYRSDMESFLPQLNRGELGETRARIPTAIGIMSGQRTRPVPMELIGAQVRAAREKGLGVAFFYFESLWNRAAEPPESRQAAFLELFPAPAPRGRPSA
ncbi:MAG: glycoside hydrolase family 10 protein [Synechococcaceae cyanobacterium]|nr:glycoside hydrolase family 10 protein [Synechococcaceae cyanobacterium]